MDKVENAASVPLREIMANQERESEGCHPSPVCSCFKENMTKEKEKQRAMRVATWTPISQFAFSAFCSQANNDFITVLIRYKWHIWFADVADVVVVPRLVRRRRHLCTRHLPSSATHTDNGDAGYLHTRTFYPLNERRTSIIGDQFASKTDVAHTEPFVAINQAPTCRCANHHFYFHNGYSERF